MSKKIDDAASGPGASPGNWGQDGKMTKTYAVSSYLKDRTLVIFIATAEAMQSAGGLKIAQSALLKAICCNAVTGYVRETAAGNALVPAGKREAIEAHLSRMGWSLPA